MRLIKRDEHPTTSSSSTSNSKKLKPNNDNPLTSIPIQQGCSSSIHHQSSLVDQQEFIVPSYNEMIKVPIPENPTTITLFKSEYMKWNTEQVASILIADSSVGGCNMFIEKVKVLVDVDFDGSSLHNIVDDMKRWKEDNKVMDIEEFALTKLERIYNKNNTPQLSNTCESIVKWVRHHLFKPNTNTTPSITYQYISQQQTTTSAIILSPLRGDALKKFLEDQPVEEVQPISEDLFINSITVSSRDKQLTDFAIGILSRYSTFLLGLKRAMDCPLFEIRGPVNSGSRTHFILNSMNEIAKKLSTDNNNNNNWLEDEFNEIWNNNYIDKEDENPPTNWRINLIESIENNIKIYATQSNDCLLSWNLEFQSLSAYEYIAAMIAIHHLAPKGRFKLDNFKKIPLDLDDVLDLICEKFKQEGKTLIIEFCIDEIQQLIGNERNRAYELVRALCSTSSSRNDLLIIPIIGGTTTFLSNENDMNFNSLSGAVAHYVITFNL